MNQLRQYWEAVKPSDSDTHYLIERSLGGPPGDWWQIVRDEMSNLQTFLPLEWQLDEVLLLAMPKKGGWGGLADGLRSMEVVVSR